MGDRTRLGSARTAVAAAIAGLVAVAAAWAPSPAVAADLVVVTHRSTFLPGDDETNAPLVIPAGTGITVHNLDAFAAHAMTSDALLPDGERLFYGPSLNFRDSGPVAGVADLPPGTYGFHCSVHEDNMHGTLVVL